MTRLTKKDITNIIENKTSFLLPRIAGKKLTAQILNEIYDYKVVEEELGIDLITLFKILKSENIYANGKRYDNSNSLSYMGNSWLIFNHQAKQCFRFKDYGKTWALTKEELENE